MSFNLPKNVKTIINTLQKVGYEAYMVGGCVRDSLLRRKPQDYDITTNASPSQMKEVFKDYKIIETGIRHGTIVILINGQKYEITTYRTDGDYSDHRHPNKVYFTDELYEDLSRRDFTINAMAYNRQEGIVDYFNGKEDLKNKVLRCVGEPKKRFEEDALRILRALRFAAQLNLHLEERTVDAIYEKAALLNYVSKERILAEMEKMLLADDGRQVLFDYRDVLMLFIQDIDAVSTYQFRDTVQWIYKAEKNFSMRLAILIHALNYNAFLSAFPFSRKTKEEVLMLCEYFYEFISADDVSVRYALNQFGNEKLQLLLSMQHSCNHIDDFMHERYMDIIHRVFDEKLCYNLATLAISGKDLKELGYEGKEIGNALNKALKKVIEGQLPNHKEIILDSFRKD